MLVKLIPKTLKGKNKINEAGTNEFVVEKSQDTVLFSTEIGPWLFCVPSNDIIENSLRGVSTKSRWVNQNNDKDFTVEFIMEKNDGILRILKG